MLNLGSTLSDLPRLWGAHRARYRQSVHAHSNNRAGGSEVQDVVLRWRYTMLVIWGNLEVLGSPLAMP